MSDKKTTCEWCKRVMPDDAGSYYHKKACEERFLLLVEKHYGAFLHRTGRKKLEDALEAAREVGD